MVLHLLDKKSWHVYNNDNVERVRRDEAQAQAKLEAEEQRMQEEDAARRTAILRGEEPAPLLPTDEPSFNEPSGRADDRPRDRTRRRRHGEDDTEREIRFAREDAEAASKVQARLSTNERRGVDGRDDAPLVDRAGHLQLIPVPDAATQRKGEKNAEFEAEKARKRKRDEDQYTMRFSNAAGFQNPGVQKPWYAASAPSPAEKASSGTDGMMAEVQGKDVWGNADPMRKERAKARISTSDPFAAMQHAQRQLKQSERDKEQWQNERAAEMEALQRSESKRRHGERRHRRRDVDREGLEGFSLDDATSDLKRRRDHDDERHRRHRHSRRRSRSPSRERPHPSRQSSGGDKNTATWLWKQK